MNQDFIKNWYKRFKTKIPESIAFMMAEQDESFKNKFNDLSPIYRDAGIKENTSMDLEDSQKNIIGTLATASSIGRGAGAYLLSRQIADDFRYETSPAMHLISSAVGDYEKVIGQAVATSEQIKYEYGSMARFAVQGALGFVDTVRYTSRAMNFIRGARTAGSGVVAATASTGVGVLVAILEAAVFYILGEIVQRTVENMVEGRARELAFSQAAVQMLDLERPKNIYLQTRSVFQDDNFITDLSDILSSPNKFGKSLTELGYDYESIAPFISQTNKYRDVNVKKTTSSAFEFAAVTGMSEEQSMSLFLTMSKINPRYKQDFDLLQDGFEKFYGSLIGNGKPQQAHNKLVSTLISFTDSYALSSGILTSYQNNEPGVTAITKYMSDALGSPMQVDTAMTTITGVDELIKQSFDSSNSNNRIVQRRRRMLQNAGMTRSEGLLGSVTEDPEMFNKAITAFAVEGRFSQDDFQNGKLIDEDSGRRFHDLTADLPPELSQAILIAIQARVQGKKAKEVQSAFFDAKTKVEKYTSGTLGELSTQFARSSQKFVDTTVKNLQTVNSINKMIVENLPQRIDTVLGKLGQFTKTIYDTFNYTKLELGEKLLKPGESIRIGYTTYKADASGQITTSYVDNSSELLGVGILPWAVDTAFKNLPVSEKDAYVVRTEKDENGNLVQKKVPLSELGSVNSPTSSSSPVTSLKDLPEDFLSGVNDMANRLGVDPRFILTMMYAESGFRSDARNPDSDASGLIQWMPSTAAGYGLTTAQIRSMSRMEQLPYVEKYLNNQGIKPGADLTDFYLAVFFPAGMYKSDDTVILGSQSFHSVGRDPDAYEHNKGLDTNKDGQITKYEIGAKLRGRYSELFGEFSVGGKVGSGSGGTHVISKSFVGKQQVNIVANLVDKRELADFIQTYIRANI